MKCMSCESEINPKWRHAIDINVCPFCGKSIIEDKLRDLFSSLRETMDELASYSDQLEDWLLSNYDFIKTTSPSIVNYVSKDLLKGSVQKQKSEENQKYMVKVQTDKGEEDVIAEKIQSDDRTNEFFKRAEAVKPNIDGFTSTADKTQKLKIMANQIKKAGSSSLTANGAGIISAEMLENTDPEAILEMQSLMSDNSQISSALITNGDDDEIPSVVLAMAAKNAGNKGSTNAADLLKLTQMQERVQNSRKNFESGANLAKGGFSRS